MPALSSRERILKTIKEEMIENIESATLQNLTEIQAHSDMLFHYAHYLSDFPNYMEPCESTDYAAPAIPAPYGPHPHPMTSEMRELKRIPKTPTVEPKDETANTAEPDESIETTSTVATAIKHDEPSATVGPSPDNTGIFHRKLVHGYIERQDGKEVFVPESIIREKDFNQGDIIEFTEEYTGAYGKPHYQYTRLVASEEVETDRCVFNNALVEHDPYDNSLGITQAVNGIPLKSMQSAFNVYTISAYEVEKFDLDEDSVVDLAWDRNNPIETMKVIWKHPQE